AEDGFFQAVTQGAHAGVLVMKTGDSEFRGAAKGNHAGDVFRTAAFATFLTTADNVRQVAGATFEVKQSDAFGGMQLVGGKGKHVHAEVFHVDFQFARGLHGVGVKHHAFAPANGGDF